MKSERYSQLGLPNSRNTILGTQAGINSLSHEASVRDTPISSNYFTALLETAIERYRMGRRAWAIQDPKALRVNENSHHAPGGPSDALTHSLVFPDHTGSPRLQRQMINAFAVYARRVTCVNEPLFHISFFLFFSSFHSNHRVMFLRLCL